MAHSGRVDHHATHRFVPTKFATGSVLETLSLPQNVLSALSELDAATNERKLAERGRNLAMGPGELLLGVPEAQIVNAAFCHPGPFGSRFNDRSRGAWYAGVEAETSMAEVAFHKLHFLEDARIAGALSFDYQDFLADFSGDFSFLDEPELSACLQPEPVPDCYGPGQAFANSLIFAGSNGILYPSVRKSGGTCIACFRPALVFHPRRGARYALTVEVGTPWSPASAQQLTAA